MLISAKISAAAAALTLLAACAAGAVAAPGDLDPTFGDAGLSVVDLDGSDFVSEIALRPDGRIVIGGTLAPNLDDSNFDGFVAQLGARGALDGSFGAGGAGFLRIASSPADGISDIAIRPDGRIVAVGNTENDGLVARLPAAGGSLDPSFGGGDGFEKLPFGGDDILQALALQPDGKLVVAGTTFATATLMGAGLPVTNIDGVFARLGETDGLFDDTFAGDGSFGEDFGAPFMEVEDVALQADGKIVYAGTIGGNGSSDIIVGRILNPSGENDPSFGGGTGRTLIDLGGSDNGRSVAIQPDGKIVVGGGSFAPQAGRADDLAVARLLANGLPDPAFAGDGSTTIDVGGSERGSRVAVQPGGKILLVGTTTAGAAGKDDMAVVRLRVDGSLDPGFGTGGRALVDFGAFETGSAIALRPDGGILVAGDTRATADGTPTDIAVARLQGDEAAGGPGGGSGRPGGPGGAAGLTAVCAGKRATIVGTAGRNRLRGTPRADVIAGLGGNDVIAGLGGNDVVCGGAGNDQVDGGAGADRLIGGAGTDRLAGGAGADRMEGGAGADKLLGGAGKDRLLGGAGADKLVGGGGVDALLGGAGRNTRTQ